MVLVLRVEEEDAQEITVRVIQNNHEFVTGSHVQVCESRLQFYIGILHLHEVRSNVLSLVAHEPILL